MEAAPRFELGIKVLQTSALPLGHAAFKKDDHSNKTMISLQSIMISYTAYLLLSLLYTALLSLAYYFGFPNLFYLISGYIFILFLFISLYQVSVSFKKKQVNYTLGLQQLQDLEMAKRVQEAILKVGFQSHLQDLAIAYRCLPAKTVGGDFFSFIQKEASLPSTLSRQGIISYESSLTPTLGVVIGDVAGHGISSALVMSLAYGLFNTILRQESPAFALQKVNDLLCAYLKQSQVSHLTAFVGVLNLSESEFTYASAGHHPAILLRSSGDLLSLESPGVFLGMYEKEIYQQKTVSFFPGDRLFFYTDGMTELKNELKEEFGLERFESLIVSTRSIPVQETVDFVFSELKKFTVLDARDDQTLVVIEYPCGPQV